jgi:glutamate--cysteine ligase
MMRATASTQISVDYRSESDFRKKYQTAYVLTPIIKYLTDHTPVYEGKPNNLRLRRSQIWNRVDKARTGIVPGVLAKDFSFHDYAEYLWHLPLVYCPEKYLPEGFADRFVLQTEGKEKEQIQGKKISAVGSLTPAQIWDSEVISEEAAWHIMSMAFPDVRLKNYVEIRGADALCKEKMLAYAALIKGTLYQPEVLDAVAQAVQSGSLTETDIKEAEECVQADGRQAVVYGQPLGSLCDRLLDTAQKALPEEEQGYLDCLRSLQQKLRTV